MKTRPKEQGILGEAKVLSKFIELGIPISIPFGDNCSYDLIADFHGVLKKIQVKSSSRVKDGCIEFTLCKSRINTTTRIKTSYSNNDVDYYALYSVLLDEIYLVPFDSSPKCSIIIRYEPSKNSQSIRIRHREEFLIDNVLSKNTKSS